MKTNNILKLSIGIPAHNEEKNIRRLLETISNQKQSKAKIVEVIVVCDGCTDSTEKVALNNKGELKNLTVKNDNKRVGKAARLNQLYSTAKGDIFLTFDADSTLIGNEVLNNMAECFTNEDVVLVGGKCIPNKGKTFVQRSLVAYESFWSKVTESINNGNNVHNHLGPISAARTSFVKNLKIPKDIVADDHYLYFEAIRAGFKFRYCKKSAINFNVPETLSDYLKQSARFLTSHSNIVSRFGDLASKEYRIPKITKLQAYVKSLLSDPFHMLGALVLITISRISLLFNANSSTNNGVWEQIKSSK